MINNLINFKIFRENKALFDQKVVMFDRIVVIFDRIVCKQKFIGIWSLGQFRFDSNYIEISRTERIPLLPI
jgi:hypothetical protein